MAFPCHERDLGAVRALLLDADGCLFPSEKPAFAASVDVVNRLMSHLGCAKRLGAEELRLSSVGKNFRAIAAELAAGCGTSLCGDVLNRWVAEEKEAVSSHLRQVLSPDHELQSVLGRLSARYELAVVSSSALTRLDACFAATGLTELLPAQRRFSAEDSLPRPTSKPDPAIYTAAIKRLGITPELGIAVEDSATGARSAVAAGLATIGNVCFVEPEERDARTAELKAAGVFVVVASWKELERLLPVATESQFARR
jgi:beta-phosphoglucomutase-like phosphatase (HAD superfamily)